MRKYSLLHNALTNHIQGNNKTQQINKIEMNKPQYILFIKQPSLKYEISIVTL